MTEMTMREFYNAIMAVEGIPTEIAEKARVEIEKLDRANATRKSKPSKTAIANEPIKNAIVEVLTTPMVCAEIVVALNGVGIEVTSSKVSALCRQLVEDNILTVADVKVKGKGAVKQYAKAN